MSDILKIKNVEDEVILNLKSMKLMRLRACSSEKIQNNQALSESDLAMKKLYPANADANTRLFKIISAHGCSQINEVGKKGYLLIPYMYEENIILFN